MPELYNGMGRHEDERVGSIQSTAHVARLLFGGLFVIFTRKADQIDREKEK